MSTIQLFSAHNHQLLSELLPKEGDIPEAYFSTDPNEEAFHQQIPHKNDQTDTKNESEI